MSAVVFEISRTLSRKLIETQYEDFLSETKKLWLSYKSFEKIAPNAFESLPNVEYLYLYSNNLGEFIEPRQFADLVNLKVLRLHENQLRVIRANTFESLKKLENLDLYDNEIVQIEPDAFAGLDNLILLTLNGNLLRAIQPGIFKCLKKLERLSLHNNEIAEIESSSSQTGVFEGLENLKELTLNGNKLTRIGAKTFESLISLEYLSLSFNQIEEIDSNAFVKLKHLEGLVLNDNRLERIDPQTFEPLAASIGLITLFNNKQMVSFLNKAILSSNESTRIQMLSFVDVMNENGGFESNFQEFLNQFVSNALPSRNDENQERIIKVEKILIGTVLDRKYLERKFRDLLKLTSLSLNFKNIIRINPDAFKSLTSLEVLWLNNNRIENIESGLFRDLTNLKELLLSDNILESISESTFESLKCLEKFYLGNNRIAEITPRAFVALGNLKELRLENNKLKSIKAKTFESLKQLMELSLDRNEIDEIEPGAFLGLGNLKDLRLKNNKLKLLKAKTFESLGQLKELQLGYNEIDEIESGAFDGLGALRQLKLYKNQLKSIKTSTFEPLKHLEKLFLNDNLLDEIESGAFVGLGNLKLLSLTNNQFTRVSREAFQPLTSIGFVCLLNSFKTSSENAIAASYFDASILVKWSPDEFIFYFDNKWHQRNSCEEILSKKGGYKSNFQEFLDQFSSSSKSKTWSKNPNREDESRNNKVKTRNAGIYNKIVLDREYLEEKIKDLAKTTKLLLSCKNFTQIDPNAFKSLTSLEVLWLNNNRIENIESGLLSDLTNLKELLLSHNLLNSIKVTTFESLKRLEKLYLDNNDIDKLDPQAFAGLKNIKLLSLNNNKLTNVSRQTFEPLNSSIGLISLINSFQQESTDKIKIVSYFNKSSLASRNHELFLFFENKWHSKQSSEEILKKNGGYKSDFNEFLQQFPSDSSNSLTPIKNPSDYPTPTKSPSKPPTPKRSPSERPQRFVFETNDPFIGRSFKTYTIIKSLGKGGFGQVYLIDDKAPKQDSQTKVVKIMDLNEMSENELSVLIRLKHKNIVKYYDHFQVNIASSTGSKTTKLFIITEFCENGDLNAKIKHQKTLDTNFKSFEIFKWMIDASRGLSYLHSQRVIHRDIKPENILLSKHSSVKLADLGSSKITNDTISAYTLAGTREYMSPEMYRRLLGDGQPYSFKTDIWSLGCVLYEMMNLKKAFASGQSSSAPIPDLGNHPVFSHILKDMLIKDPKARIDSSTVFNQLMKTKEIIDALALM